jgi:hypothetical protein
LPSVANHDNNENNNAAAVAAAPKRKLLGYFPRLDVPNCTRVSDSSID